METKNSCESGKCSCCKRSWVRILIKIVVLLMVLSIVGSIGFAMGARMGAGRRNISATFGARQMGGQQNTQVEYKAMGQVGNTEQDGQGVTVSRLSNGVGFSGAPEMPGLKLNRLFGSITKIDGNKITVLDNGATNQTVVSSSSTIILMPTGEVTLSALKAGQNIECAGSMSKDGTFDAKSIQLIASF